MNRTKHQHTVPQFYLRRFADSEGRICVYDKKEMRSFVTSVRNVAGEHAFLDVPELEEHGISEQFMEKEYLAAFEHEATGALEWLVTTVEGGRFRGLDETRLRQLARFIVIQSLRTGEERKVIADAAALVREAQARAHLEQVAPEHANDPFAVRPGPEAERILHARHLLDVNLIEKITDIVVGHLWFIHSAPAATPLWTFDNPVVRHGHRKDPVRSMRGFSSPGVEIACPIKPTLIATAAETSFVLGDQPADQRVLAQLQGQVRDLIADNVTFYNSLQVRDSSRFLFASGPDFNLAEGMCSTHPDLRDPDRPRVVVSGGPWANLGGSRHTPTGSQDGVDSPPTEDVT